MLPHLVRQARPLPLLATLNRGLALLLLSLLGACGVAGCSAETKGGLMLAVQTDMKVPEDIDFIEIEVRSLGRTQYQDRFRLGPKDLRLPATLAVISGSNPSNPVTIRLVSRQGGEQGRVRTLREVVTTAPSDRVATLNLPIQWLCDGQAEEVKDAEGTHIDSTCPDAETCVSGRCVSQKLDSSSLPDFTPEQVFGGGEGPNDGRCFDTLGCFANGAVAEVEQTSCTILRPEGTTVNVGLLLPAGSDGICGTEACIVPLDADLGTSPIQTGWREQQGRIVLPQAVCDKLATGEIIDVAVETRCPTKNAGLPTCGPWSAVGDSEGTADAGAPANATVCQSPSDPTRSALCLRFEPETVDLLASEPELDGKGRFDVKLYSSSTPSGTPLAEAEASSSEVDINDLPTLRFDNLPPVVFVLAALWDNPSEQSLAELERGGGWLGGFDPELGDFKRPKLERIRLETGKSRVLTLPMTALRRLDVSARLAPAVTPADDGTGFFSFRGYASDSPAFDAVLSGHSERACVDVRSASAPVSGVLLGAGPHFLLGTFDDYDLGGVFEAPGSIAGSVVSGAPGSTNQTWSLPAATVYSFAPTAYTASTGIELGHAVAAPAGETPFTCGASGCNNGSKDSSESDVDCGGACSACEAGLACVGAADCQSRVCTSNVCQAPSCSDSQQNGDETGPDCGGSCDSGCDDGQNCLQHADCQSGNCVVNVCEPAI